MGTTSIFLETGAVLEGWKRKTKEGILDEMIKEETVKSLFRVL